MEAINNNLLIALKSLFTNNHINNYDLGLIALLNNIFPKYYDNTQLQIGNDVFIKPEIIQNELFWYNKTDYRMYNFKNLNKTTQKELIKAIYNNIQKQLEQ